MRDKNVLLKALESRVLDSVSEHVIYYNKDFKIQWVNRAASDSVNLLPFELIGKNCYAIWQNNTVPCENCPVLDALNTGKSNSVEMTTPDGRVWLVKGYPVNDKNNKIIGAVEITREITERKAAEQKLKESEEKYRNILENMMEGYFETDLIGNLVYVNSEYCKIMGYSKEEVIGKNYRILYDKKSSEVLFNMFNQIYKTGIPRPPTGVAKVVTSKNKLIYFEGTVDLLYDSKGNQIGFYGFVRDITKRKIAEKKRNKTEEALKESEQKFRTIAEQSFMSIIIIQDGILQYFNERLPKVNGYSPEEIKNWKPYEFAKLIHPDDRDFVMDQAKKKESGKKDVIEQYKYRMIRKDGEIRWLENFSRTINYRGRPADFIISIDITEQMNAEKQLKKSETKYREAFNRSNFYKDLISHDINNILQNILSSVELCSLYAEEEKDLNELQRMLKISKRQVNRGANLILNARKLSRLEDIKISTQSIEATEVLNQAIEYLLKSHQDHKINFSIENPYKEVKVRGNELLIDVFENILINAVKYTQNFPIEIKIKVSKLQKGNLNFVKFEFIDYGIGIPDINKEVIFQRAFNINKTVSGMGIGLSLVKAILESYNGQIWVEDRIKGEYSQGSNFILLIPEL